MINLVENKKEVLKGLFLFVLTAFACGTVMAEPVKIAIIPFSVHSEKEMSFLQEGINDMIMYRFSGTENIEVISREEINRKFKPGSGGLDEKKARKIGDRLNADHIIFGSLTVLGNSVSINAKMVDVSGARPAFSHYAQAQGLDEVLPSINLFVDGAIKAVPVMPKHLEDLSGGKPDQDSVIDDKPDIPAKTEPAVSAGKTAVPVPVPEAAAPVKDKKERSVAVPGKYSKEEGMVSPGPGPAFIPVLEQQERYGILWKSKILKTSINGMAIGDVDGDGTVEIAVIEDHELKLFRYDENRFSKAQKITGDKYKYYIGVDIADINGNGYHEIFVSGLDIRRRGMNSFVLEWNGETYKRIGENTPWFYRTVNVPGRGMVLFGQKLKKNCVDLSGEDIVELEWLDSAYQPLKTILPAGFGSLAGFTFGDIAGDGNAAVAFDNRNRIRISDSSGEIQWEGSETYGGSTLYVSVPSIGNSPDSRCFFPTRLYMRDIDGDGGNDLIAVKNYELTRSMRENFRNFTGFQIEALMWDRTDFVVKWKTRKFSGQAIDYAVGDFDRDGKDELITAVVIKKEKGFFSKSKSMFIAYELTPETL